MTFLAPALLAGLAALALPVAAHLLGRERPEKIPFAATRFLRAPTPPITQRRRIRDVLLLLVRLLILLALVATIARPVAVGSARVAVLGEAHDAMLLIDASASMELRVDGRSERSRIEETARRLLEALPAETRVGAITTDPTVLGTGPAPHSPQLLAMIKAWAEAPPTLGGWTMRDALPSAAAKFDPPQGDLPRVIYAIGDRTVGGLDSLPDSFGADIQVIPIPLRDLGPDPSATSPEHVGLTDVSWDPAPDISPRAVRIHATVARWGGARPEASPGSQAEVMEITAALLIGDQEVARASVEVAPNSREDLEFTHTLAPHDSASGARRDDAVPATIALLDREADPLPVDDRRHLWLSADQEIRALVINGDPSEQRVNDEVFFLATAVDASASGMQLRVRALSPDQLEARLQEEGPALLDDADLLLLANVRAPSVTAIAHIRARVEAGMGLWISVGDRVTPTQYNERFGDLLPLPLRGASFAGTSPGQQLQGSEGIAPAQSSHPIFADLERDLDLDATRIKRMMLLEPDPRRPAEIALTYTSGAPALITRDLKMGRVALLTTSIDRDWGDLPLRPGFVPLVQRTVAWLVGEHGPRSHATVHIGQPLALLGDSPLEIQLPSGERRPLGAPRPGERLLFEYTLEPGHYVAAPHGGPAAPNARQFFVVEVDPAESETLPTTQGPADATDAATKTAGASVEVHEPRWRTTLWIAVLLIGLESALRLRRRSPLERGRAFGAVGRAVARLRRRRKRPTNGA